MNNTLLITVTSGRPTAFEYLARYVKRQTFQAFDWLVVTDNAEDYKIPKKTKLVEREATKGKHSMIANWHAALEWIDANGQQYERFVIMEDDDFYVDGYLFEIDKMLDKADLVGFNEDAYYYVLSRRVHRCHNRTHASLAATAFTREVLPFFKQCLAKNSTQLDTLLWLGYEGAKLLHDNFNGLPSGTAPTLDKAGLAPESPRHVGCKENWHQGTGHVSTYPLAGGIDNYGHVARRWFDKDAMSYLKFTREPKVGTPFLMLEIPDKNAVGV